MLNFFFASQTVETSFSQGNQSPELVGRDGEKIPPCIAGGSN